MTEQIKTIIAFDLAPGDQIIHCGKRLHVVEVNENRIGGINVHWNFGNGGEPAMSTYQPLEKVVVVKGPGYQP